MILTYCFRLLPTTSQHRALERILESQRLLYNAGLEERIDAYRKAGITRTYYDQCAGLTAWRQQDPEGSSVPVKLQRWTLKRLDDAHRSFFRRLQGGGKPGFPRFRGKGRFNTFGFSEFLGIRLNGGRIRFKGMPGSLRIHFHRSIPESGRIRCCFFRRGVKGWKVGFAVEVPAAPLAKAGKAVGVDLGITTFIALSDGGFIPSLRAARRSERRLRIAQRALARKARDSAQRAKAKAVLARSHAAIRRKRHDYLDQASARLVREYQIIVIEKLNVGGLARGPLARDVHDAAWSKFISMLRYKAAWAGRRLIEVDPFNTSQECSRCSILVPKTLDDRLHSCALCGLTMDRDLNAARNILNRAGVGPGLRNVVGFDMRAGGNLGSSHSCDSG